MKSEIICIGTELLMGQTLNTNVQFLSQKLAELGMDCYYQSVVGDNSQRLNNALSLALSRSELIITTGGLGPTFDDMTKSIMSEVSGIPLVYHQDSLDKIVRSYTDRNLEMTENNKKQALVIEGSHVFKNETGSAPGFAFKCRHCLVVVLPGPPKEMQPMVNHEVAPYLEQFMDARLVSDYLYLFGIGESSVEASLSDEILHSSNPSVAPYASVDHVVLRVTSKAKTLKEAQALNDPMVTLLSNQFKNHLYSINQPNMAQVLVDCLIDKSLTIATAESLTGGKISDLITSVDGSSKVFKFGACTYDSAFKESLLSVSHDEISNNTPVTAEVAKQMAIGIQKYAQTDIGIGITGVAGPTTYREDKPVGLVYIAVAIKNNVTVKEYHLSRNLKNERQSIKKLAALHALKDILDRL
ncbi:MAG: competence/damage-inducible protein A [Erysipelothrix sp.]